MGLEKSPRPVFIVGSPRSGTSVLTWCLGQHPNLLAQEESNWIGNFAVNAAVAHADGSARGERSQLSASGISLDLFLGTLGEALDRLLLGQRGAFEKVATARFEEDPAAAAPGIQIARTADDPKQRWVDGTPEYSLQMPALRRLFPEARFIHLVRDANEVVRSMMKFQAAFGIELVPNEAEAWSYWTRTVRACLAAERGWGAEVVLRVRYRDLVSESEATLARILQFLGEPWAPECLDPLAVRINSSSDAPGPGIGRPDARAARLEAESLEAELKRTPASGPVGDPSIAASLDAAFFARVKHFREVDGEFVRLLQRVRALEDQLAATPR